MRVLGTDADDPATRALLAAYFAERVAGFPGGGYRVAAVDAAAFDPPGALLRVDDDAVPLGVGGVRPLPADGGTRMEVKHLYVVPSARGRGVGRLLLGRLEAVARDAGADLLVLDTNRSLEAAGALYRSAGFTPAPPYNDNPNATDWYAKPLR